MSKFLNTIKLSTLLKFLTCFIPVAKWRRTFRRYLLKREKSIGKFFITLVPVAKYRRKWRRSWLGDSPICGRNTSPLGKFSDIHILCDETKLEISEKCKAAFQKVGIQAHLVTKVPSDTSVPLLLIDPPTDFKEIKGSTCLIFFTGNVPLEPFSKGHAIANLNQVHSFLFSSLKNVWKFLERGENFNTVFYLPLDQEDQDLPSHMKKHFIFSDQDWFEYFLFRFLLAQQSLDFNRFYECVYPGFVLPSDKICLTLPESRKRLMSFCADNTENFFMFPGLRHSTGWIGCGMSYKFLMKKAKEANLPSLLVCEDDVEFLPNTKRLYQRALHYLSKVKEPWDIFSCFIADLHPRVEITVGNSSKLHEKYAHLNKMTSMVMNLYHSRFYEKLEEWDENNTDLEKNTIDRFIENHADVTTIASYPYIVGHKKFLHSTLWNNQLNTTYDGMVEKSEEALRKRVLIESRLKHQSPCPASHSVSISVIIPVLNAEKYLCKCLESVLNQTLHELEVICIDKGSTDRTLEILSDYVSQDHRLKVIRSKEYQRSAAAKAGGRQQATGRYLGFLYPDDIIELSFFETLYEMAIKSEADIVLSQLYRPNENRENASRASIPNEPLETLLTNSTIQNHSHLFSSHFLQNNPDIEFLADDQFSDMFFNAETFSRTDKILDIQPNSPKCYSYARENTKNEAKSKEDIYKQINLTENTLLIAQRSKVSTGCFLLLLSALIKANNLEIKAQPFPSRVEYDDKFFSMLEKNNWDYPELQNETLSSRAYEPFCAEAPLLSVIVPIYNVEQYLISCLDSIKAQTFQNMEIICVEDASTDNSRKLLEEYIAKNPRFRFILKEKNEGLSQARNTGITQALAPYIAFVDSDDTVHAQMYEKMMRAMLHSNADVVVCGVEVNYEAECLFMKPNDDNYFCLPETGLSKINSTTLRDCNVVAWNKIFRKSLIDKYSLTFPAGLHFEDNAFFWKYFTHARNVFYLKNKLYKYFRRLNSITGNIIIRNDIKHLDRIRILEDIHNHLIKYNLLHEYSLEFYALASEHINISKSNSDLLDKKNKRIVTKEIEKILSKFNFNVFKETKYLLKF